MTPPARYAASRSAGTWTAYALCLGLERADGYDMLGVRRWKAVDAANESEARAAMRWLMVLAEQHITY